MPFKTKLTPNFQMNWGHNFPKATYPTREKIPVRTFDLKSFVNKKREEKINSMLGGDTPSSMPIPSPFGGGAPFNPFMQDSAPKPTGGFNVDDLVKRIDAKIAELEEEERQEQARMDQEKVNKQPDSNNSDSVENIDNQSVVLNNSNITDDQFFDDFFSDE